MNNANEVIQKVETIAQDEKVTKEEVQQVSELINDTDFNLKDFISEAKSADGKETLTSLMTEALSYINALPSKDGASIIKCMNDHYTKATIVKMQIALLTTPDGLFGPKSVLALTDVVKFGFSWRTDTPTMVPTIDLTKKENLSERIKTRKKEVQKKYYENAEMEYDKKQETSKTILEGHNNQIVKHMERINNMSNLSGEDVLETRGVAKKLLAAINTTPTTSIYTDNDKYYNIQDLNFILSTTEAYCKRQGIKYE